MNTDIQSTATARQSQIVSGKVQGREKEGWLRFVFSPLWLCLLIALILHVFVIIRTHGAIEGDESLVGIQAQSILRGEIPIYFYGQAYMGSLEAYLIAGLFSIFGSAVWVMRLEGTLLALVVVWLTWRFAGILADTARLTSSARQAFMTVAAFCAAITPVYDGLLETHMLGGYVETFVLMLLLLISAFQLTRRWQEGTSYRELLWRWAVIGLLIGLGLWVDPLIISAIIAACLWIAGAFLLKLWRIQEKNARWQTVRELLSGLIALPTAIVGLLPAIIWGASHQWANVTYLFTPEPYETPGERLTNILKVTKVFAVHIARRVIGGATPLDSPLSGLLHTCLFLLGAACIIITLTLLVATCFRVHAWWTPVCRMLALPALFALFSTVLFCVSKNSEASLIAAYDYDAAGRYATPIMLALPFFYATAFTLGWYYLVHISAIASGADLKRATSEVAQSRLKLVGQILLLLLLAASLSIQALSYGLINPDRTYLSLYCSQDPFDNDPILTYMQEQHIHYFWADNMLGYPLDFKSNGTIIGADPLAIIDPQKSINRLPSYIDIVMHADRPSMLFLVPHSDTRPAIFQELDHLHVTYRSARFYAQPDFDVVLVTPLNRTVSPLELSQRDLFYCLSH